MNEPNWSDSQLEAYGRSARAIGTLVRDYEDLLRGLRGLGEVEPRAESLIEAMVQLPDLKKIRLGWQLFETLTQGDGLEPEVFLYDVLPADLVELLTDTLAVAA